MQASLHRAQVPPVDRAARPRFLGGVRHAPEEAALLGSPVDAGADVERHRRRLWPQCLARLGDDHLVACVPDPGAAPGSLRHRLQGRPSGQEHALGRDRAGGGLDPGHDAPPAAAGARAQAGERHALAHLDAEALHGERVRAHVAGWVDPAVGRHVRAAAEAATVGHRRDQRAHLVVVDPSSVEPGRALHLDALASGPFVGRRHREDHVSPPDEARVDAVALALTLVEVDRPRAEAHRVGGAPLRPHHARGPARRAHAHGLTVDHDDPAEAGLAGEHRRPSADRAGTDDHQVGRVACAHRSPSRSANPCAVAAEV